MKPFTGLKDSVCHRQEIYSYKYTAFFFFSNICVYVEVLLYLQCRIDQSPPFKIKYTFKTLDIESTDASQSPWCSKTATVQEKKKKKKKQHWTVVWQCVTSRWHCCT